MTNNANKEPRGFTVVETAIVVAIAGIVLAFAVPNINNAMKEYRANMAMRQMSDLVSRAKMQAIRDNTQTSIAVDSANNRAGIIVFNTDGTINRTDWVGLPQGITFGMPPGLSDTEAPIVGVPVERSVSFSRQGSSTTVYQQDFNSRGFPRVTTPGAINAMFLTNGRTYRAVTLSSVGEVRKWTWDGDTYVWSSSTGRSTSTSTSQPTGY